MYVPKRVKPLDIPMPRVPTASDANLWRKKYCDALDLIDRERRRGDHWQKMACLFGFIMGVEFGVIVLLAVELARM